MLRLPLACAGARESESVPEGAAEILTVFAGQVHAEQLQATAFERTQRCTRLTIMLTSILTHMLVTQAPITTFFLSRMASPLSIHPPMRSICTEQERVQIQVDVVRLCTWHAM